MERLTKYGKTSHENGVCCTHFNGNECTERMGNCTDNCPWEEAVWSRLAAYEDTGLAPEDCAAYKKFEDNLCASGVPFSRIIELVNAEKEGRITIHAPARKCPQCRRNQLVVRTDGKFYYCFGCKTQFAESEIQEARP